MQISDNETANVNKPIGFWISALFAILGLATPLFAYLLFRYLDPAPSYVEETPYLRESPGNAFSLIIAVMAGIYWWVGVGIIGLIALIVGLKRKETGRTKIPAILATILSWLLLLPILVFFLPKLP
jgi:hypothetical protein